MREDRTFKLKRFGNSVGIILVRDLRDLLGITDEEIDDGAYVKVSALEKVIKNNSS